MAATQVFVYITAPLAVSVSMDQNRSNYSPGHFDPLSTELAGEWLGHLFVAGAVASFVGLYNAQIIVCERSMGAILSGPATSIAQRNQSWYFVRYLLTEHDTGVAPVFIIFNAILSSILVWLPYVARFHLSMP